MNYPHLATRVYNVPLLIHQPKLKVILDVLEPRFKGLDARPQAVVPTRETATRRPYRITPSGVAIVPVIGTLVQRSGFLDADSGLVSYQEVSAMLASAQGDSEVRAVLLEMDSFGGEGAGLFDLADRIYQARTVKPIWAVANEAALSAGYALASSAERVFLPRTGEVGSIGVVALHVDQSAKDQQDGLAYTYLYAGERKIDGNPHQPLSDTARSKFQGEVDRMYDLFVAAVARNRGLSAEAVRATRADIYSGQRAVDLGLADGVASFDDVATRLGDQAQARYTGGFVAARTTTKGESMSDEKRMEQAAQPAAPASPGPDVAAMEQAAAVKARTEERARIKAIFTSAEANGRQPLAGHLAFESALSAEDAVKLLAASPKTGQPNPLEKAMAGLGNPAVGPDARPESGEADKPGALAANMAGLVQARGPKGVK